MENLKMKTFKALLGCSVILLSGCKKESNTETPNVVDCHCGDVTLVSIWYSTTGGSDIYKYESRNNCTNAPYRFETQTEYTEKEYCLNHQW